MSEFGFSGWAVEEGYADFILSAQAKLEVESSDVIASINPDSIRGSLHHPNGFLVNTLENSPEGQLRLHIWPVGRVDDLTTPHSHPWHMVSRILAGTYREYLPEVQLDDSAPHQLMGTIFNAERKQVASSYLGRNVDFRLGELASYGAGEYHMLPAGEYHVTPLPETEAIITLVRTSLQLFPNPTFVLRQLNQDIQLSNAPDRKPPTDEEVAKIWKQLVPILEAVPSR